MTDGVGRTVIIGLDGCTFDVIKPWADEGILPNFASLCEKNAWGVLTSTYPPMTMPAWITFSTGKDPGRFGIYGFFSLLDSSYDLKANTHYHARDQVEFWDILNAHGLTCGILNYPLMDRPVRMDGYCVPGFMASEVAYKTYPENLRQELDNAVDGYELDIRGEYIMGLEELLQNTLRIMNKRADAILYLLREKPVDVFLGIFTMTDRILHRMYNLYGPGCYEVESPSRNPMARFFHALDERLGEILDILDEKDLLFIISDHGFSHAERVFHINNWLIEQGWLRWKGRGLLYRLGITQKNIGRIMYRLGLYERVQRWAPSALKKAIPPGHDPAMGVNVIDVIHDDRIDWSRSKAVALQNGPKAAVYFNTEDRPQGIVRADEVDDLRNELLARLGSLVDPDGGKKVEVNAYSAEELYLGNDLTDAADLHLDFGANLLPTASISEDGNIFGFAELQAHAMEGMFIASHPWVEPGRVEGSRLIDIIPTVLHLLSLPLAEEMDGRVLEEILSDDSEPRNRPIRRGGERPSKDTLERERIADVAKKLRSELDK